MAITIQYTPGTYLSAHGDLIFTVLDSVKASDPVTYPDYRYVCDVYIGTEQVARLKAVPRPDNNIGVFNVGNIIRNYVAVAFNPAIPPTNGSTAVFAQEFAEGAFYVTATMKFGEEYGFTLYTNLTVDSARVYFNHYNGRLLGQNTVLSGFVGKILTNRPIVNTMPRSCKYWFLPYLPYSTTADQNILQVYAYKQDGTFVGGIGFNRTASSADALQLFNISVDAINAQYRYSVGQPGVTIISDQVAYLKVWMITPLGTTPVYTFNLVCEPRYTTYTLHFLNKYGGFESREFIKVSRKTVDIEREEFGKLPYMIDASGQVSYKSSNNVYNETRTVYSSQYSEKMVLNTDILTDDEYAWLGDLVISPLVYIEMNGYFIPVVITGNNYEYRKSINDKLTNLTLNLEFGDQFNAQYR